MTAEHMRTTLDCLKKAWLEQRPDYQQRCGDLHRLRANLKQRQSAMTKAINADFEHRSRHETLLGEAMTVIGEIDHCLKHLKHWMKQEKRKAGWQFWPAKAEVRFVPLGVVGIIAPWNYPVNLALAPLVVAIAAGNHVFLKPSEHTPHTAEFLRQLLADTFPDNRVAVVTGGADIASAFSSLPFDHLLFTGSSAVGRKVMAAAAENLTPVTLELGGKSPAFIGEDTDLQKTVSRIITSKLFNAGQTCIAPDYVLLPAAHRDNFIAFAKNEIARRYSDIATSPDYSHIINDAQFQRLNSLLIDAKTRGCEIIDLGGDSQALTAKNRRFAPVLVIDPPADSTIMCEEIFGPILPILTYQTRENAIALINRHERPLALYIFSDDRDDIETCLSSIVAGGVCINDTLFQFACKDLPFGGVGASGMGHYHAREGFRTFSKAMPVLTRYNPAVTDLIRPPYSGLLDRLIGFLAR